MRSSADLRPGQLGSEGCDLGDCCSDVGVGKLAGADVAVTGMTAWSKDFLDTMKSHLPIVFAFVLALAFLLLVTFRSIVVPIKATVLHLLSVGAAYGVLTLVFQQMKLLGNQDWYLPRRLGELPKLEHEPQAVPAAA